MITEIELRKYEEQARKTLESHFVRTGYDLAPTIIRLVAEIRELKAATKEQS